MSHIPTKNRIY